MIRALLRIFGTPRRNPQPPTPRHVPAREATQAKHWRTKRTNGRAYATTHAALAAELGMEWPPRREAPHAVLRAGAR